MRDAPWRAKRTRLAGSVAARLCLSRFAFVEASAVAIGGVSVPSITPDLAIALSVARVPVPVIVPDIAVTVAVSRAGTSIGDNQPRIGEEAEGDGDADEPMD
ncbi:hypothetical protein [Devosia sp.]|uniref:hypothetical protein n=1 Tax=Devosia sp. TaxID=1871048 RepID=UPI003F7216F0